MPPFRLMMLSYRLKRRIHDVQSETMGAYSQHCGLLALKIRWARQQNGLTGWNNPFHRDTSDRLDSLAGLLTRWSRRGSVGVR